MGKTNIVKQLRLKFGMNQAELADKLGVTQSVVSNIEKTNNMTAKHAIKLSELFGVSIDYLLLGVDNVSTAFEVTPTEREILKLIKEDSGLMKSLTTALTAKKNVMNRLAA